MLPQFRGSYRGSLLAAEPSKVHFEKSISLPHPLQICAFLNSSEKISFSFPHSGHLHTNDRRSLKLSHPGQCAGVFIIPSLFDHGHVSNPLITIQNPDAARGQSVFRPRFFDGQFALVPGTATGAKNFHFLLGADVFLLHGRRRNERYISTCALRTLTADNVSFPFSHLPSP